jgi:hypothetical protein
MAHRQWKCSAIHAGSILLPVEKRHREAAASFAGVVADVAVAEPFFCSFD